LIQIFNLKQMENYNQTDQYIHQVSQVLAKLGRSYVSKKEDDSHTNLYWEPLSNRMLGRWITTKKEKVLPVIKLDNMSFQWLDTQMKVKEEILFVGKNYWELENLIADTLNNLELKNNNFQDPLHFNIPDYSFKEQPMIRIESKDLEQWSNYRSFANHVLNDICALVNHHIEVRIWPHHFDTGIYFQWNKNIGIGAGLAMQDSLAGAPYFYISGYTVESQIEYTNAMPLSCGKWIKQGPWKGAILPVTQFTQENAQSAVQIFIFETIQFLQNQ